MLDDFAGRAHPPDSSWQPLDSPPDEDNGNIVFRVLSLAWKNPGCGLVTWTLQIWRQTKIYLMEGAVKYKIVAVVRKIQNILERLQKGLLWLFEVCQSVIRTNLYSKFSILYTCFRLENGCSCFWLAESICVESFRFFLAVSWSEGYRQTKAGSRQPHGFRNHLMRWWGI